MESTSLRKRQEAVTGETITHAQRENAYAEGGRAFDAGLRRTENPYAVVNPTLEQIWWNGWDHSRKRKHRERLPSGNDPWSKHV